LVAGGNDPITHWGESGPKVTRGGRLTEARLEKGEGGLCTRSHIHIEKKNRRMWFFLALEKKKSPGKMGKEKE